MFVSQVELSSEICTPLTFVKISDPLTLCQLAAFEKKISCNTFVAHGLRRENLCSCSQVSSRTSTGRIVYAMFGDLRIVSRVPVDS